MNITLSTTDAKYNVTVAADFLRQFFNRSMIIGQLYQRIMNLTNNGTMMPGGN
jgi:hypothetical protein